MNVRADIRAYSVCASAYAGVRASFERKKMKNTCRQELGSLRKCDRIDSFITGRFTEHDSLK